MSTALADFVRAEEASPLPWTDKAAGQALAGRTASSLAENPVALSELATPVMTLEHPTLRRNVTLMQEWSDQHQLLFAPHGKTTMAPALWLEQLEAGAWGITVATEAQLRVAVGCGVKRVHLANTLLSRSGLRWLVERRAADAELEAQFWIDSTESVRAIERTFDGLAIASPLPVLLEVGMPGGRTGTRSLDQSIEVAAAISDSRSLALVGVAGYEGAVHTVENQLGAIDGYLAALGETHQQLTGFYSTDRALLSAGGSAYFDRVAAILGPVAAGSTIPTRVLLRSGAYIAHDDGLYARTTPSTRGAGPALAAALHLWSRVISIPETGRAILDAGRRDAPYDQGPPIPQQLRRRTPTGSLTAPLAIDATVTQLNDQHAFLEYTERIDIHPGDLVRLGISHPCTAFDKWRSIPLIDDAGATDPSIHGIVRTYF